MSSHFALNERIVACARCPRLRDYCAKVAAQKRAAFRSWAYWGRPVPNFVPGAKPQAARLLIVGLAPAAHGANRTGRMFTGDRSGDFLFRAMHAAGFASQPTATHADDGLQLRDAVITAVAHCAPPDNKPTPAEIANCSVHLRDTFAALPALRVVVCLGRMAHDAVLAHYLGRGLIERRGAYPFAHGAQHVIAGAATLISSYHPSQQNTFTGRLTDAMLLDVFHRARHATVT